MQWKRWTFSEHSVCIRHIWTWTKVWWVHCPRDKRHSQIFYICLFMVCDCSYMPSNAYMCRVVGSLLENQLHIRWIIRLAQGDIRDTPHGEKPDKRVVASYALEPLLKLGWSDCVHLVKTPISHREKVAFIYICEPQILIAFIISGKRDKKIILYTR